jgi:type IV secretory pathway component VirB8
MNKQMQSDLLISKWKEIANLEHKRYQLFKNERNILYFLLLILWILMWIETIAIIVAIGILI